MPEAKKTETETDVETDAPENPWGEGFDAAKAWSLVQNLRAEKAGLRSELTAEKKARKEAETARDSAISDADGAKKDLATDRRASILKEFEIDEDDAEEFLSGELTLDELRRKAERLAGRKSKTETDGTTDEPQAGADDEPTGTDDEPADEPTDDGADSVDLPERPKPRLTPGRGGAPSAELDLDAIARNARRR